MNFRRNHFQSEKGIRKGAPSVETNTIVGKASEPILSKSMKILI